MFIMTVVFSEICHFIRINQNNQLQLMGKKRRVMGESQRKGKGAHNRGWVKEEIISLFHLVIKSCRES